MYPFKLRYYVLSFLRHDLRASITVFFVALPLCLGISLASGAPVYSGLVAGIAGGLIVSLISGSRLSVSGPAAGLTAISAAAIAQSDSLMAFFLAVSLAGLIQIGFGLLRLGDFTHFIPSAVIKGMLAAIGILLISKQIPLFIGYDQPEFWTKELFNILTLSHVFTEVGNIQNHASFGITLISVICLVVLLTWKKIVPGVQQLVPASFMTVVTGTALIWLFQDLGLFQFSAGQYISLPDNLLSEIRLPELSEVSFDGNFFRTAALISVVASLESLLSIEAIDKMDSGNRSTPMNRELIAQGTGNFFSGLFSGLPVTAVIVRSAANAEAGARSRLSSFMHGIWLVLVLVLFIPVVRLVPYCVLSVILIRTGYQLARPSMIKGVYRQGKEQFLPFIVTAGSILLTDLLIGVGIGILYSIYFLMKHTYRAGFTLKINDEGHLKHYNIQLAMNVSYLNKKGIKNLLESIPPYSVVEINGMASVYIDHDILEIFHDFKSKASRKHIEIIFRNIPEVVTIRMQH